MGISIGWSPGGGGGGGGGGMVLLRLLYKRIRMRGPEVREVANVLQNLPIILFCIASSLVPSPYPHAKRSGAPSSNTWPCSPNKEHPIKLQNDYIITSE